MRTFLKNVHFQTMYFTKFAIYLNYETSLFSHVYISKVQKWTMKMSLHRKQSLSVYVALPLCANNWFSRHSPTIVVWTWAVENNKPPNNDMANTWSRMFVQTTFVRNSGSLYPSTHIVLYDLPMNWLFDIFKKVTSIYMLLGHKISGC